MAQIGKLIWLSIVSSYLFRNPNVMWLLVGAEAAHFSRQLKKITKTLHYEQDANIFR